MGFYVILLNITNITQCYQYDIILLSLHCNWKFLWPHSDDHDGRKFDIVGTSPEVCSKPVTVFTSSVLPLRIPDYLHAILHHDVKEPLSRAGGRPLGVE